MDRVPPIALRVTCCLAAACLLAGVAGGAVEYRTIRGEVVAVSCPAEQVPPVPGESAAAHTMRCARQGLPMAIQTDEGRFLVEGDYTANRNAKLQDFIGKPIEAKGQVGERDGVATINVAAMMVQKP